jgi:hypothetical protein
MVKEVRTGLNLGDYAPGEGLSSPSIPTKGGGERTGRLIKQKD